MALKVCGAFGFCQHLLEQSVPIPLNWGILDYKRGKGLLLFCSGNQLFCLSRQVGVLSSLAKGMMGGMLA